jgi:integrase/recombinase XerD
VERKIFIPRGLYDRINECFKGREFLFETQGRRKYSRCYVSEQIAKLGKKILGRKISAHTFRHSFATNMLKRGVPVEALSRYLGHSSVKMTLDLYCHAEMQEADIFEFVREMA